MAIAGLNVSEVLELAVLLVAVGALSGFLAGVAGALLAGLFGQGAGHRSGFDVDHVVTIAQDDVAGDRRGDQEGPRSV